ncbi:hypothetical protein J8281_06550 [Aquimarina sp. U1-2]|uniref:hypothetical protein n=1 Tax=Aquimarina sp. U1-2 TaxID=2823141 RepID=UPI001AECF757|nr:hypothetical protein [Aquimarina sp. U1-2]MBP2831845.1 hypothetical protein [Aquimarina sp. U1-2]
MEETYNNSLLFPGTKNQVEFIWEEDSLHFNTLLSFKIAGHQTEWKTKEGITLGNTIEELEVFNKKPFTFYGLE